MKLGKNRGVSPCVMYKKEKVGEWQRRMEREIKGKTGESTAGGTKLYGPGNPSDPRYAAATPKPQSPRQIRGEGRGTFSTK